MRGRRWRGAPLGLDLRAALEGLVSAVFLAAWIHAWSTPVMAMAVGVRAPTDVQVDWRSDEARSAVMNWHPSLGSEEQIPSDPLTKQMAIPAGIEPVSESTYFRVERWKPACFDSV